MSNVLSARFLRQTKHEPRRLLDRRSADARRAYLSGSLAMMSEELKRALARPDVGTLIRGIDAYALWCSREANNPAPEPSDDFEDILSCYREDPDKALAYVVIGASRSDDPYFLSLLGCGPLEDVLRDPSTELLARIVAEARRSARFRWLLSNPFRVAVAERAWTLIENFRVSGPHEEPSYETLPPRESA